MSDMEYRYGKIKKLGDFDTLEFARQKLLTMNKPKSNYYDMSDDDDVLEYFLDEFYEQYVILNGELYEIVEDNQYDSDNMFESKLNSDGTIDYRVAYYNGGCDFGEALEEALENMEK